MHLLWKKLILLAPGTQQKKYFIGRENLTRIHFWFYFPLYIKSCHQNSYNICRESWKFMSSLYTINLSKRKCPKCLVSWRVRKRDRGWERGVENLLLHSASLTLLPLGKLHKAPWTSIVSPARFEHFPPRLNLHASTKNKHVSHPKRNHSDKKQPAWKDMQIKQIWQQTTFHRDKR